MQSCLTDSREDMYICTSEMEVKYARADEQQDEMKEVCTID